MSEDRDIPWKTNLGGMGVDDQPVIRCQEKKTGRQFTGSLQIRLA